MTEREPIMPRLEAAAMLIFCLSGGIGNYLECRSKSQHIPRKQRPCIACGKDHDHNNAFCSGDCCRAYRARKATP